MMGAFEGRGVPESHLLRTVREEAGSERARQAASDLLSRYQDRVYAWCCRHLGDADRARDVAQEALLAAYRGLPRFEGRSAFAAWLFTIARNKCINELKRPSLLYDDETDPNGLRSEKKDPARTYVEQQDEEAVKILIKRHLSHQEQQVLWLRCFERMPVDSITSLLGIQQASGARGVLQTARRKLRAALRNDEEKER